MKLFGLFNDKAQVTVKEINPEGQLRLSVEEGDFKKATEIVEKGEVDVKADSFLISQAILNVVYGDVDASKERTSLKFIETMIKRGADVNVEDQDRATPILHVASNPYANKEYLEETAKLLRDKGARFDDEAVRLVRRNTEGGLCKVFRDAKASQKRKETLAKKKTVGMKAA